MYVSMMVCTFMPIKDLQIINYDQKIVKLILIMLMIMIMMIIIKIIIIIRMIIFMHEQSSLISIFIIIDSEILFLSRMRRLKSESIEEKERLCV